MKQLFCFLQKTHMLHLPTIEQQDLSMANKGINPLIAIQMALAAKIKSRG